MKVLVFDLKGRFAHFRKFYTNSSSLSYLLPPRTTLMGIVAAVMGLERDSYYELFSSENLHLAVRIMFKPRKIMQTLNYLKIENPKDVYKVKDHTQVPFEVIASQEGSVTYRVYLSHRDEDMYKKIKERISCGICEYPPYFGAAPFSASIEYVGEFDAHLVDDVQDIVTPINKDFIEKLDFNFEDFVLARERMPRDFDTDRLIKDAATYIFEECGKALKVKLKCSALRLENGEGIVFM
ncbi:type I-B CRISPR-associated protein Cas5b [Thermobrachium celere]|uniref:type I-B CRISPR-associated protein Cas5b n=1 Tax=Thermobrachium celere TaxID=53422 RepID=UPI001943B45D|nr:type I-B CRISPR-associated protein Cas5b [Thermobrachium celere]GFR35132.1 type I-B CRISPR-associated protein Cas5 [Thermobrachium celere]